MAKEIFIYRGYEDGSLDLSEDGYTEVGKGRNIKWKIDNRANPGSIAVTSIKSMTPKMYSSFNIFTADPSKDGTDWKAKIKDDDAVKGKDCEYWISWIGKDGITRNCDPIIAVKPTSVNEQNFIIGIAVAVVALVTFQFLWKRSLKKRADNRSEIR